MAINYTLQVSNNDKKLIKTTTDKKEFLRIVMTYAIGNYEEKLNVYNDIIKQAEKQEEKQSLKLKDK